MLDAVLSPLSSKVFLVGFVVDRVAEGLFFRALRFFLVHIILPLLNTHVSFLCHGGRCVSVTNHFFFLLGATTLVESWPSQQHPSL